MTCGIYELKIGNDNYVGQSVDIGSRWKQHNDKFHKGTAARNLQAAFNLVGDFVPRVIYECHPDHLDILENYYIDIINPTLNTSRPPNPFKNLPDHVINKISRYLGNSTIDMLKYLDNTIASLEASTRTIASKDAEIKRLSKARTAEELDRYLGKALNTTQRKLKEAEDTLGQVTQALILERNKSWWKKLFN